MQVNRHEDMPWQRMNVSVGKSEESERKEESEMNEFTWDTTKNVCPFPHRKKLLRKYVFFFFIISIASSIATGCWTKHYQKAQIRLSSSLFWYLDTNNYNTDISFYVEPTHIYILYILFLLSFYLQNCYQVAGNFSIKLAVKDIPVFYWKCSLITFLHTKLRVVDFKIQYNMQNGKNNQQTFHSGTSGIHGIQPNVLWRRQNLLKVA